MSILKLDETRLQRIRLFQKVRQCCYRALPLFILQALRSSSLFLLFRLQFFPIALFAPVVFRVTGALGNQCRARTKTKEKYNDGGS